MKRGVLVLACTLLGCDAEPPCSERVGHVCAIAGTGELGFNRDGVAATEADLFLVSAARRGPDELVYLMDFNNQRLRRIDEQGHLQTVIGNGFHALADVGLPATDTPLENPIDFAFLSDGRIVFVSYHDPRVIVLDHDGHIQAIAGTGDVGVTGDEGDGGPPLSAMFIQLDGIAVAPDDTIYVSDSLANRVRRIDGDVVTTIAGTGELGYAGDGGPATQAAMFWPTALLLDDDGAVLVAEARNHVVRRIDPSGTIATIVGTGVEGFSGDGGPAIAARLRQPNGLARDEDGTLYIADRANFRVRAVAADGTIDTVAGTGVQGNRGDDGPALAADFGYLARITLDDDGLLVADQSSSVVRRITLR